MEQYSPKKSADIGTSILSYLTLILGSLTAPVEYLGNADLGHRASIPVKHLGDSEAREIKGDGMFIVQVGCRLDVSDLG